MRDVPWTVHGCPSAALHCLACGHGAFARDRHRALADCEVGVWLLAQTLPNSDRRVLAVLRETASRDTIRLWAVRAPFETKDELKARGYRWMPERRRGIERAWWTGAPAGAVRATNTRLWRATTRPPRGGRSNNGTMAR